MMTRWTARGLALRSLIAVAVLGGLGLTGCGKKPAAEEPAAKADLTPTSDALRAELAKPVLSNGQPPAPGARDRLHQAFADAVRTGDHPPADEPKPVDQTDTGKSTYKLMRQVTELWDNIRFTTPAGKKIEYNALIETDFGTIEMALFPELAPNHVRNFVALARAGYYDGLVFEYVRHDEEDGKVLRGVEAGSPTGKSAPINSSIGYWLRAELHPGETISHDEGIVGACRGREQDSAACRFYINLTKAPWHDNSYTIFGKVVRRLDVVRTIYAKGAVLKEGEPLRLPESPVVINKVTVQTSEK